MKRTLAVGLFLFVTSIGAVRADVWFTTCVRVGGYELHIRYLSYDRMYLPPVYYQKLYWCRDPYTNKSWICNDYWRQYYLGMEYGYEFTPCEIEIPYQTLGVVYLDPCADYYVFRYRRDWDWDGSFRHCRPPEHWQHHEVRHRDERRYQAPAPSGYYLDRNRGRTPLSNGGAPLVDPYARRQVGQSYDHGKPALLPAASNDPWGRGRTPNESGLRKDSGFRQTAPSLQRRDPVSADPFVPAQPAFRRDPPSIGGTEPVRHPWVNQGIPPPERFRSNMPSGQPFRSESQIGQPFRRDPPAMPQIRRDPPSQFRRESPPTPLFRRESPAPFQRDFSPARPTFRHDPPASPPARRDPPAPSRPGRDSAPFFRREAPSRPPARSAPPPSVPDRGRSPLLGGQHRNPSRR